MDARQLQAQLLKGRQSVVESVNGIAFTIRRPTEMELILLNDGTGNAAINFACIKKNVVGWSGVKELDVVPGGASDEVAFDPDLFRAWIEDHEEHWPKLIDGFAKAVRDHDERMKTLKGN